MKARAADGSLAGIRVLATDAADRKSLAAVRALGRAGAEVAAAGSSPLDPALSSRYCSHRLVWPSPATQPARFVRALERALRTGCFDVLLPMSDHTTMLAVTHAWRLSARARMAVPDSTAFDQVASKWRLVDLSWRLGIRFPATWRPQSAADLREAAASVPYPCVVKPVRGAGPLGF